ncbi:unnamed protein product [Linum tenue]|uniref:Uncharacterized protein n=1 Tax=Linum tenue TaxID=586396 RepID=A0AAV0INM0_9ROSI|nr:unnamed protein product [Linum tenue]
MMLIGRWRQPCNASFLCSLGNFVEHLPLPTSLSVRPTRIQGKSVYAVGIRSSSYFEALNSRQQDQIRLYVDTLLQWNQKMNLTAVTSVDEVMERHVEDSLALIPPINHSYSSNCSGSVDSLSVVDVGTGPGLPGLILAAACPDSDFPTLVVGQNLGQDVSFREQFDVAVARAVAEMRILVKSHSPHGQRTAIICLKDRRTPKKYPREPGTPAKSPV